MQLIFQDPTASLPKPARRIGDIVAEPLRIAGIAGRSTRERRGRDALSAVGLGPDQVLGRLPHDFSGGQCQRICIAVSALDVLEAMKARSRFTLLFIAHDLAVVKAVSDRVTVMYLGRLCEVGPTEALYCEPAHPCTRLLLETILVPDPEVEPLQSVPIGEPPSPLAPPSGCRFRTRCARAGGRCAEVMLELREIAPGGQVAYRHPLIAG
jgi:peptide/nickel transport system ATP-binding protein